MCRIFCYSTMFAESIISRNFNFNSFWISCRLALILCCVKKSDGDVTNSEIKLSFSRRLQQSSRNELQYSILLHDDPNFEPKKETTIQLMGYISPSQINYKVTNWSIFSKSVRKQRIIERFPTDYNCLFPMDSLEFSHTYVLQRKKWKQF